MNIGNKTLKNGMRLIYIQDNTKHQTEAKMIINYGNKEQKFEYNNNTYHITNGSAHLLEHAIIENITEYYQKNNIKYNGKTSHDKTIYYIKTVNNFNEHLKQFLIMINKPHLTDKSLSNIKQPIYSEIEKFQDNPYTNFFNISRNNFFKNTRMTNVLGTKKELEFINKEYLNLIHHVFYQPKNETLCLIGNFDLNTVEKIIENTYTNLDIKNVDYKLKQKSEPIKVNKKIEKVINNNLNEIALISFKIDINSFLPKEKSKLTFYLDYFLTSNFSDNSLAFKKVINDNLSSYSFNKNYNIYDKNILEISINLLTKDIDKFKKIVLDTMKNPKIDAEDFYLWNKENIINILNRNIFIESFASAYISNILDFDYNYEDKLSDIEAFNLNDYIKMIKQFNYDNYTILYQIKEKH